MANELTNDTQKLSYALGMNLAASVLQLPPDLNLDRKIIARAVDELLCGGQPQLPEDEYHRLMKSFQQTLQEKAAEQKKAAGDSNAAAGKKFLEENAKKDGVKVTASGLQYIVLQEGEGDSPAAADTVKVHYEGTLVNGQVFDSSIKRGEPIEFPLNQVIPGWTEGVQLMKPGAKYRFFIPSHLAYGEQGAGGVIAPNSTLIFDVELLGVVKK